MFEVERGVACMSALIKNMIRDCVGDERIPLPNVKTAILNKVVDYCKYHKNVPPKAINKLLTSNNLMECGVSAWDSTFLHIEQGEFFNLIMAGNYVDIERLLPLTCTNVAAGVKGKSAEETQKQCNLVNDFTLGEEAHLRENFWCEEPWN